MKIISGKTILLNTKSNSTFVANDLDASIPNHLNRENDKHIEWAGELSIAVTEKEYRPIAEELWQILDDIDTASDIAKPTEIEGYKSFYNYAMRRVGERFKMLTNDKKDMNKLVINHESYQIAKLQG